MTLCMDADGPSFLSEQISQQPYVTYTKHVFLRCSNSLMCLALCRFTVCAVVW